MTEPRTITVNEGDQFAAWLRAEMTRTGLDAEDLKRPPMITSGYIRMLSKMGSPRKYPSLRAVITLLEALPGWNVPNGKVPPNGPLEAWRPADDTWPDDHGEKQVVIFERKRKPAPARQHEDSPEIPDVALAALNLNKFLYKRRLGQGILTVKDGSRWKVGVRTEGDSEFRYFKLSRLAQDQPGDAKTKNAKESFAVAAEGPRAKDNSYCGLLADFDDTWELLAEWVARDKHRDALMAFPPALIGALEAMGFLQFPRDAKPRTPQEDLTDEVKDLLQPLIDEFQKGLEKPTQ